MANRQTSEVFDDLLVLEAQQGSSAAFSQLVRRWTPQLLRHAARLLGGHALAQDAVQDAWIAIARSLRGLKDPARFAPWAFAITTRRSIDLVRRAARESRLRTRRAADFPPAGLAGSGAADGLDLTAALLRLPVEQRLVASLFYGEGLGVEGIAASHGLAPGTVKSRLHAARTQLKKFLQGDDHD